MAKHRALEDTIQRARHYGAIAKDALALFPASPMKEALEEAVEFCIARSTREGLHNNTSEAGSWAS